MVLNSKRTSEKIFEKLYQKRVEQDHSVGFVQLYDLKNSKKIFEKSNLIVGLGRQYVAQRLLTTKITTSGYSLVNLPTDCENLRNYDLTHYAFGGGGAIYSGGVGIPDDVELTGPDICDTSLMRPITFDIDTFLNDPSSIDEGDGLHKSEKSVKPIIFGNNSYEYSIKEYPITSTPTCEYYTQFHFTIFKEEGEFGPMEPGESVQVSEAGLYITYQQSALLFARICFPPKFMELESQYGLEWYILC